MSFSKGKCPNCNAPLKFEGAKDTVVCEYCKSTFFMSQFKDGNKSGDSASTPPPPPPPPARPADSWSLNIGGTTIGASRTVPTTTNKNAPPRPTINPFVVIVLMFFYVFPAVIYIGSVARKQREWDRKYT